VGDLDGVGVVSSLRDDTWPSSPPVGSVSDGVVRGHSLCMLSGRSRDSSRELIVSEGLFVWGDEMKVDVDVNVGANDCFDSALGKTRGRGCLSLGKAVRLLIAG